VFCGIKIDFLGIRNDFLGWLEFFFFFFSFARETKMATVVAGFLSPWPLGWISTTSRLLGVDRSHPQWRDLCIFFFFFLVCWFARERDMATEGGRISPPGHWGGSWPPPVAKSIFFFFFFLVRRKCHQRWAVGSGAVSQRWAVGSDAISRGGRWIFFGCLIC
jgi:hypothetical protein